MQTKQLFDSNTGEQTDKIHSYFQKKKHAAHKIHQSKHGWIHIMVAFIICSSVQ